MGVRRSPKLWWAAGAFLLLLVAGWVFWSALKGERARPRSELGPAGLTDRRISPSGPYIPGSVPTSGGLDPQVQDALRTVEEINRINRMNQELRQTAPPPNPTPDVPPSTEAIDAIREVDQANTSTIETQKDLPKKP